ncbi:hypothetical protein OG301_07040 [Streptomyces platensis]|uniref:hypothetical protein n=1 Tax=Streptomyces platensis TaxID=58346 RepID=UPI002E27002B|nr:hypothetical protein OG301_07040 [Streptomyces platensis]WUB83304.1 hypothetical protein OG424_31325 [Streptomyces platensis]
MRRISKAVVAASLAIATVGLTAPASQAATAGASERGTSGCFNWSYSEGTSTTTVYWHNTCNKKAQLFIWWKNGAVDQMKRVDAGAHAKGHIKHAGSVKSIEA